VTWAQEVRKNPLFCGVATVQGIESAAVPRRLLRLEDTKARQQEAKCLRFAA